MQSIKLAIAPLTWSNDDLPDLGGHISFERCIDEMAEAGYDGCEIGSRFPERPEDILKALAPRQLRVAGQWFSAFLTDPEQFDETLQRFADHCVKLARCQADVVIVSEQNGSIQGGCQPIFGGQKLCFSPQQWQALIAGLHHMGGIAQRMNLTLVYHQHMGTGVQTQHELDYLMQQADSDLVGLLFDTGHLVYAGIEPMSVLQRYASRIHHVHLKDCRLAVIEQVKQEHLSFLEGVKCGAFTVPGDGDIDFGPIMHALHEQGYRGWLVVEAEQDPDKAHPLTYARIGYNCIQSLRQRVLGKTPA